jgi:hypothetical protein
MMAGGRRDGFGSGEKDGTVGAGRGRRQQGRAEDQVKKKTTMTHRSGYLLAKRALAPNTFQTVYLR